MIEPHEVPGEVKLIADSIGQMVDRFMIDAKPKLVYRFDDLHAALAFRTVIEREFPRDDHEERDPMCAAFHCRGVKIWITCTQVRACRDGHTRGVGDLINGRDFATTV